MNVTPEDVALSIAKFLSGEIESQILDPDNKESLEVALDCIRKVYQIEEKDHKGALDIPRMMQRVKDDFNPEKAEKFRLEGNRHMQDSDYLKALECYDKAILHDYSNHVHYANRAAAYLKLERYSMVIEDCNFAISLNPISHKAYIRKGIAYMNLKDYRTALLCCQDALDLDPNNQTYKDLIEQCKNKLKETPPAGGFEDLLNNPNILNMAQSVMQDPRLTQMFSGVVGQMSNPDGTFDFNNMMAAAQQAVTSLEQTNPEFLDQLRNSFGFPPPE